MAIPLLARYKTLLGSNEHLALMVLKSISKKYKNDVEILHRTDSVFQKQNELGIIELVPNFDEYKKEFPAYSFLSHFPLVKEDRTTTKIRVIYMANLAQKGADGSKGFCVNDCVHPGFCKNFKISHALTLMRFDPYLLTFDISKAYHRMGISDENSSKFCFFWFKNIKAGDYSPVIYRCKRVVFGLSCAPFLLTCALHRFLIEEKNVCLPPDEAERLQRLKNLIYQGSYVDNIFVGCKSKEEIEYTHDNSEEIFNQNFFPLQQFVVNDSEYQLKLDKLHNEITDKEVKVLGMKWNRINDSIKSPTYRMNENVTTKRQVLKEVNSNYDLTNANLPVLNRAKLFLRNLQLDSKLEWDDPIENEKRLKWKTISKQFNTYEPAEIPRYVGDKNSKYTLVLLSDASKDFLRMVIYLKENETNKISYLISHNKMLNKIMRSKTIAVLEFAAIEFAVEKGLEIFETFSNALVPINITEIKLFTDSSIALSWLSNAESLKSKMQKRSVFINNRINNVVDKCRSVHEIKFAHIGTEHNSADFVTRMVSPKILRRTNFLSGPSLLKKDLHELEWVTVPNPFVENDPTLPKFVVNNIEVERNSEVGLHNLIDLTKFSSLNRAIRTLQTVKRFINVIKTRLFQRRPNTFPEFDPSDVEKNGYAACERELLQMDQRLEFPELFHYFETKINAKKKIPPLISQMNIILDPTDSILKVKSKMGKLTHNTVSKIPILLSNNSSFMKLLAGDMHRRFSHAGVYFLLHQLKSRFLILKSFSAVRKSIQTCFHCRRFNQRTIRTNTNDYKSWMISPKQRLFETCFVDYFGPYWTLYGNQKTKTYGVIFKCIWSKAISVQVINSADAKGFLMSLQSHIYEYGLPKALYSDSGSNFTAAFPWIRETLDTVEVREYLNRMKIDRCTFEQYPKGSLNRGIGGIIESGVSLIRKFIHGSIGKNILDYEQFCHVVKQSVCFANKRPLTNSATLRDQGVLDEVEVLTPELLKFGYETCVLELNLPNRDRDCWSENELNNSDVLYENVEKLLKVKENLRKSYYSDFLYGLIDQATKLRNKYVPVKHQRLYVGDIVLIKDSFVKAINYPLAVVTEVIINSLGESTQAVLYKANKSYVKRDISSLILLVRNEQSTSPQDSDSDGNFVEVLENKKLSNVKGFKLQRKAAIKCNEKMKAL